MAAESEQARTKEIELGISPVVVEGCWQLNLYRKNARARNLNLSLHPENLEDVASFFNR